MAEQAQKGAVVCFLRGALTDELAQALLLHWSLVRPLTCLVNDPTRLFASAALLRQLKERGVSLAVAQPIRVLVVTLSPFAPSTPLSTEQLAEEIQARCPRHPALLDVVSGLFRPASGN
jgi:hypothetical protein